MKTLLNLIVILIISITANAQATIITSKKQAQIEEYIQYFEDQGQLMGQVSISENGTEVINKTIGEANKPHSSYMIGSITKMLTATMFMQLSEKGDINLSDNLSSYFPEIPNSENIELRHMLDHTSGLKDYVVKEDTLYFWLKDQVTQDEIISEIIRQDVSFRPGDSLSYSNSAYYLLARVLEKKYEKPYRELVSQLITKPLELENTYAVNELNIPTEVNSYQRKTKSWTTIEEFYLPNASGAGDIISTPQDLNKFMQALFDYKLVSESTLNTMLPNKGDWFGTGIMMVPFYDDVAYGHGGDTYGTHSVTSYNTENKLAISYIINGENYPTNDFAIGLLSIIYDKEHELPDFMTYSPNPNFTELYEGTYGADGFPLNIKIYEEENELNAQGDGQPSFILNPTSKHNFDFKPAGLSIEFKPYENKLVLTQAGQDFVLTKI